MNAPSPSLSQIKQVTAPYPGLRPFCHEEAEIFFGREQHTDQLLEKLQHAHFIAVVGPSGCGKSSLVRAGMIAGLETGFLVNAGASWRIVEMRPGDQPIDRLADALLAPCALGPERGQDPNEAAILRAMLRRGPLGLVEILRETPLHPTGNMLLLVDQFEEIFRFREQGNADVAEAFVMLLLASAAQREVPIYVVITMRSDFLGDCPLFPGLPETINESQFLTPRLSRDQIRAAIVGPAHVFSGDVEPALVNRLLNDIGSDSDQLPLLQHALMRMWARVKKRSPSTIPLPPTEGSSPPAIMMTADYEAVGALSAALSHHADQVLASLTERQQHIARAMLCRLTERGVGKRDTRRPARADDVAEVAGVSVQEVIDVVEAFRQPDRSFLTPPPPVPITAKTVLDIGHESLIRQWHKLDDWVEDEAISAVMYRRLLQTAELWKVGKAALWSNPDLDEALKWRLDRHPTKPWALRYGTGENFDDAMKFLEASEEHAEEVRRQACAAEEARRTQEEHEQLERRQQQAKKLRLTRWATIVLVFFVIVTGGLAWWAFEQKGKADKLLAESHSREIAAYAVRQMSMDPALGLLAAMEAYRTAPTPQAKDVLQQAVTGKWDLQIGKETWGSPLVRATPDGNFVVVWPSTKSLSSDQDVRIWNSATGGEPRVIKASPENPPALSSDGKYAAIADSDTSIRVWDTATSKAVAGPLRVEEKFIESSFSPDGQILSVVTSHNKLNMWETKSWRRLPPINARSIGIDPIRFSDDSKYLMTMDIDKHWHIWKAENGQEVQIGDGATKFTDVKFSPDGKYIVATTSDGIARLWNMESRAWASLGDKQHAVHSIAFSPDGAQILTIADDNFAQVWSIDRQGNLKKLGETQEKISSDADFSPDGKSILITGLANGSVQVWRNYSKSPITLEDSGREGLSFSQNSRWIVSDGSDGRVKLWDAMTGKIAVDLPVGDQILEVFLGADSRHILATSQDGIVKVWNTPNLESEIDLAQFPVNKDAKFSDSSQATMTPNSKYLLAVIDGVAYVWNTSTGQLKARLRHPAGQVDQAFLSRDGKRAITTSKNEARVWDIETSVLLHALPHKAKLLQADFNGEPDGRMAWTWNIDDGLVKIWNLKGERPVVDAEIPLGKRATYVTISPDAKWLLACMRGCAQVQVRRLPSGEKISELTGHTNGVNNVSFSPDGKFAVSTSLDQTAKVWKVGTWRLIATLKGHHDNVTNVIFSPNGQRLATISSDNSLRMWETATWKPISELPGYDTDPNRTRPGTILTASLSQDGQWLATGMRNGRTQVWDMNAGRAIAKLYPHRGAIINVAFTPDNKEVVTASMDGTIRRHRCDICVPTPELLKLAQQHLNAIGRPMLSQEERLALSEFKGT